MVNQWLEAQKMTGISPNDWSKIKEMASGIRREYALFPSNTTPDIFKKDVHLLIAALDQLASWTASEGKTLRDLSCVGLVDPDPLEKIALIFLEVSSQRGLSPPQTDYSFLSLYKSLY